MPNESLKRIDIGDLTESVTIAVQRALETRKPGKPNPFENARLICGIILEPQFLRDLPGGKPQ